MTATTTAGGDAADGGGVPAGPASEVPMWFRAGDDDLFAILARPTAAANGLGVVLLSGAGAHPSFGINQVRTRLSDRLAAAGFHVLRVDWRGVGDSSGEPRPAEMAEPWTDEVAAAARHLLDLGVVDRVLLAGLCFGGRSALLVAPDLPGIAGVATAAAPIGDANHFEASLEKPLAWYLRRAASPATWRKVLASRHKVRRRVRLLAAKAASLVGRGPGRGRGAAGGEGRQASRSVGALRRLVDAEVPLLLLMGELDDFHDELRAALDGQVGRLLAQAGDRARVVVVPHRLDGLASVAAQATFADEILAWAVGIAGSGGPGGRD